MRPIPMAEPLVSVRDLAVVFDTDDGPVRAVDGAGFALRRGAVTCLVGESGSGKSLTARALMALLPHRARWAGGTVTWRPEPGRAVEIGDLDPRGRAIRAIRGGEIALISQEPMAALSPVHSIGQQLVETIRRHRRLGRAAARAEAAALLGRVGIPRPAERLDSYPFEFSGGMRQRVCIALALAGRPRLLIADEPTTALDVTTQATILDLLRALQAEDGLSILFITHDLGVVAEIADDVIVMYLGAVVERGSVRDIFYDPQHPYTQALLRSVPRPGSGRGPRLAAIPGMVPPPFERPGGCSFHTRCDQALAGLCDAQVPGDTVLGPGRVVRCLRRAPVPESADA